jgi:phage tail-like protein
MTCGPHPPTFRLLDAYVGWDPADVHGIAGLRDPAGLRLAGTGADRQVFLPWFPDRRLAPAWYLATACGVLRRDTCGGGFVAVWPPGCAPEPPVDAPVAVAASGHWLAVAEPGRVRVWWREGEQLVAVVPFARPGVVALAPDGGLYVAAEDGTDLWRYRPGGAPAGVVHTGLPGRVDGLRVDRHGGLWLLTEDPAGPHVWHAPGPGRPGGGAGGWVPASLADLAAALPASALTATWDGGFCLGDCCYTWDGQRLPGPPPPADAYVTGGDLRTAAIDSGLPRCRWHRVRVDADVPPGTALQVCVAVTEEAVVPGAGDWQEAPPGALDFLVDQPPGRHLYVRLRLSSDGTATPVVRRVRLDFPRSTSADLLPATYREDPTADDFTERFLSLFDSSLAGLDRVVERYPALLDVQGVPDAALPWLGGLLGLAFEAGWDATVRRALLAAAPELYRRRGTPWAVAEAVRIVFGVTPAIEDLAARRSWLLVGERGRLGSGRLFGRSAARFRVGTSALGSAPLRSFGDPHGDPLSQHAYRFRVVLPPRSVSPADEPALRRLVASQAPAHTAATVHLGGHGWVVGIWSAVGVDTGFDVLPEPVLGPAGEPRRGALVRLGRHSVLAASRRGARRGMAVGERMTVGVQSVSW